MNSIWLNRVNIADRQFLIILFAHIANIAMHPSVLTARALTEPESSVALALHWFYFLFGGKLFVLGAKDLPLNPSESKAKTNSQVFGV